MAARLASTGSSLGAVILSVALLPLLLHKDYQPSLAVGSLDLRLTDLAVAAVVVAAIAEARRIGYPRLRTGRWIWLAAAALFAAIAIAMLAAAASDRAYPLGDHLVTAGKYAEYALLAPAVPLLVRQRAHARIVFATVAAVSAVATIVGILQFAGAPLFEEWPSGRRQPSFLGHHDFAALSGAALALGMVTLVLGDASRRVRRVAAVAGASGVLGLIVSGAVTGAAGLVLAVVIALLVAHGVGTLTAARGLVLGAVALVVVAGVLAIRSDSIAELRDTEDVGHVETFSHRGVLAYIGIREFAGHPLLGIGWQASFDESGYGPYIADARRRYPEQPARVFPSPEEPWGIQNAYLQALAELGLVGGLALAALLAAGFGTGLRVALRSHPGSAALAMALTGTLWLCIVAGIWNGIGLVAGLPLDAVLWLALGLVASAAAGMEDAHE